MRGVRARYEQALAMLEGAAAAGRATTRQVQLARCLGGLGQVLAKLSDDDAVEERLERALAIQDRVLAAGHPDRGALDAGIALLRQTLSIRPQALGAGHPDTLESTCARGSPPCGQRGRKDRSPNCWQSWPAPAPRLQK